MAKLHAVGAAARLHDLYGDGLKPVQTGPELAGYSCCPQNCDAVAREVADVRWCDTLIFVYPTWWYGLPAMLKGWLDRVLLPDVAFMMPDGANKTILPGLHHIGTLGVFTVCGASRWLTWAVGAPGKRTLMREVGLLLRPVSSRDLPAGNLLLEQMRGRTLPVASARFAQSLGLTLQEMT